MTEHRGKRRKRTHLDVVELEDPKVSDDSESQRVWEEKRKARVATDDFTRAWPGRQRWIN